MKKVIKNGKVAVLYSRGCGAGWYSWNKNHPDCLFHPDIVALVEQEKEVTAELCKELFGEDFYAGGAGDLEIEWLPEGMLFQIDEYYGSESVTTRDGTDWTVA